MSEHKKRAELRAENKDPINYMCGGCKKVVEFDKKKPYVCPFCGYGEVHKEE